MVSRSTRLALVLLALVSAAGLPMLALADGSADAPTWSSASGPLTTTETELTTTETNLTTTETNLTSTGTNLTTTDANLTSTETVTVTTTTVTVTTTTVAATTATTATATTTTTATTTATATTTTSPTASLTTVTTTATSSGADAGTATNGTIADSTTDAGVTDGTDSSGEVTDAPDSPDEVTNVTDSPTDGTTTADSSTHATTIADLSGEATNATGSSGDAVDRALADANATIAVTDTIASLGGTNVTGVTSSSLTGTVALAGTDSDGTASADGSGTDRRDGSTAVASEGSPAAERATTTGDEASEGGPASSGDDRETSANNGETGADGRETGGESPTTAASDGGDRTPHREQRGVPGGATGAAVGVGALTAAALVPQLADVLAVAGNAGGLLSASSAFAGSTAGDSRRRLRSRFDRLWRLFAPFRYSRWDDSDPLEHDVRAALYETIEQSPGAYLSEVCDRADVALSTARHHLDVLEDEGLVTAAKVRGKRRYYPGQLPEVELTAALEDEATASLLHALARLGPSHGGRIADELDRDPSTVSHHLSRLADAGLVEREREGRAVVNRLAPDVERVLCGDDPDAEAPAVAD